MFNTLILLVGLVFSSFSIPAAEPQWQGTFAATLGTGGTAFAGTWDAAPGPAPDTVAGTWSLRDAKGAELATGTWAAGREGKTNKDKTWKGTWQARRPSGQVYDGDWESSAALPATAHFPDLFQAALAKAVSGSWWMGKLSGAWTIRAYASQ
ncbi:MAG TPA: hypothetical protein VFW44_00260 [Bryobacteraceae bacterium]|nr:hypothetical protein [Bryobacteraceae bacterium]